MTMITMSTYPTRGEILGIASRIIKEGKDVPYALPQRVEARIKEATRWLERPDVDQYERDRVAFILMRARQGVVKAAHDLVLDARESWASAVADPSDRDWIAFGAAVWCRRERCRRAALKTDRAEFSQGSA